MLHLKQGWKGTENLYLIKRMSTVFSNNCGQIIHVSLSSVEVKSLPIACEGDNNAGVSMVNDL